MTLPSTSRGAKDPIKRPTAKEALL